MTKGDDMTMTMAVKRFQVFDCRKRNLGESTIIRMIGLIEDGVESRHDGNDVFLIVQDEQRKRDVWKRISESLCLHGGRRDEENFSIESRGGLKLYIFTSDEWNDSEFS